MFGVCSPLMCIQFTASSVQGYLGVIYIYIHIYIYIYMYMYMGCSRKGYIGPRPS